MNKVMMVSLSLVAMGFLTGCVTVNKNDGGSELRSPCVKAESYKQKFDVGQNPVEGKDQVHVLFGLCSWGSSATHVADAVEAPSLMFIPSALDIAKNGAYANACDSSNADSIIATRYKITTEDYFVYKKITAELKGFPAKMTSLEKVD
jgi:hypothetical protein